MNKNQAMLNFLQTCPSIRDNPLFFNFGKVENGAHQANMRSDDVSVHRPYIDGTELKRFTFHLDSFKSIAYNPIVEGLPDENLEDFNEVQDLLDWINEQDELKNYPAFEDCIIDKMRSLSSRPELVGVNTTLNPPTAVYRISIQIDYLDTSKQVWN
jgi:hypothetical protein